MHREDELHGSYQAVMLVLIAALAIGLGALAAPLVSELTDFTAGTAIFVAACFAFRCQNLSATLAAGFSYFLTVLCRVMRELLRLPDLIASMHVAPWAPLATLRHLFAFPWLCRFALPLAAALATHLACTRIARWRKPG